VSVVGKIATAAEEVWGSPEPQSSVQVKELSQATVINGKPIKFDFTKNATCIVYPSTPVFGIYYGIASLFTVLLYKRK